MSLNTVIFRQHSRALTKNLGPQISCISLKIRLFLHLLVSIMKLDVCFCAAQLYKSSSSYCPH